MCGSTSNEKTAANQQSAFTAQMTSQAGKVFGADNSVFNTMVNAYSKLLEMGPSQQGFSAAQRNEMTSSAITNNANQFRFVSSAAKAGQAGYGGGNTLNTSGIPVDKNAQIGEASAANTANELNQIDQADWAQGNKNWQVAGAGMREAPNVFGNLGAVDSAAQTGLDKNMENAKSKDAAGNWWVKPVMGIANAGLSLATGGLSTGMDNMMSGLSFMGKDNSYSPSGNGSR